MSFRCATASHRREEDLPGSASTVRAFLLLEHAGGWGVDAVRDARLPGGLGRELLRRAHRAGVRVLLVRRAGRTASTAREWAVFAASARPAGSWLEAGRLTSKADVLDLDLDALRAGRSVGLGPHPGPLYCVCTHGRHDPCCAERGRPVAAALAARYPEATWEVSHIGGDRFAGNMLVLPHGLYYGRLDAGSALEVAEAQHRGELRLDRFRGRSCLGMGAQAGEVALRRQLTETGIDAVHPRSVRVARDGAAEVTTAVFEAPDGEGGRAAYAVTVRTTLTEPVPLTCRALRDNPARHHEVLEIRSAP